jgi:uncharacterized protein YjdB
MPHSAVHPLNLKVGQTVYCDCLAATSAGDFQGNLPVETTVSWTSSDDAVATVALISYTEPGKSDTATAVVTGVGAGTCTITADAEGVSDVLHVSVSGSAFRAVKISPGKPS